MGVYKIISQEMKRLPLNEEVSEKYCSSYSGILCVDGKYVKVKGYEKKIPFIYAIDYDTHDIPVSRLSLSESTDSYLALLRSLRKINYPLKIVIGEMITDRLKAP